MAIEKKKKVSERTTEIIPREKKKMSSFNKFFIASTIVVAAAGAIGAAKGIADTPVNINQDKHILAERPQNRKNGKENGIEKFAGMTQDELDRAMLDAATKVDAEKIKLLIRAGADMDARTSLGWTPLMIASQSIMSDDAALLLISSNANLDAKNDRGMTALMIAAMFGRTSVVKALIEGDADIDATDNRGRTAYDIALKYEWKATVELLRNGSGND